LSKLTAIKLIKLINYTIANILMLDGCDFVYIIHERNNILN